MFKRICVLTLMLVSILSLSSTVYAEEIILISQKNIIAGGDNTKSDSVKNGWYQETDINGKVNLYYYCNNIKQTGIVEINKVIYKFDTDGKLIN